MKISLKKIFFMKLLNDPLVEWLQIVRISECFDEFLFREKLKTHELDDEAKRDEEHSWCLQFKTIICISILGLPVSFFEPPNDAVIR